MRASIGLILAGFMAQSIACSPDRTPEPTVAANPPASAPALVPSAPTPAPTPTPAVAIDAPVLDAGAAPATDQAATNDYPLLPTPTEEDAIREAVFRHMFQKNASGQQQTAGVYCISAGADVDPSPELLARLKDVKPVVKGVSACTASAEKGVVDKQTKKRGLIFRVESIKVASDHHHATVDGGYYEAGLSASGNVYTLEKRAKGWVVVKDEMMWIS